MASSGMLRRVAFVRTDVSEGLSDSIIRVTRIGKLETTLAVTSFCCHLWQFIRRKCDLTWACGCHICKLLSLSEVKVKIGRRHNPSVVQSGFHLKTSVRLGHCEKPYTSLSAPLLSDLYRNKLTVKILFVLDHVSPVTCKVLNLFLSSGHE
jgi:hypothetical protein